MKKKGRSASLRKISKKFGSFRNALQEAGLASHRDIKQERKKKKR